MDFLYVIFLLVGIPMLGILIGNLILEYWDDIVRTIKGLGSCISTILVIFLGIAIAGILGDWMFKAVEEGGIVLSFLVFVGFIAVILSGIKK